ncbi:hypothetical protein ACGFIK_19650 [Micromonospora sp. NPDC048871]|uniref:hypothetical protein n=1 Tax=unclassified Micromonospora TaxID=2617518 RepID=UPI002E14D068|nr:hypothetical protein OIE53_05850 [Micromonospora sp. NBC_01739]
MTIFPARVALTVVAGAVLPVLLLTGCASDGVPDATASSDAIRAVPDDLCDRVDYALATPAFDGGPTPIPPVDDDRGPNFRCAKSFFEGDEFRGGFVFLKVQSFGGVGEAGAGFERSATVTSAEPFEGGSEIVADAVRYQQLRDDVRIEILDANVIMEVRLTVVSSVSDEQAAAMRPTAVRLAVHALDLIRAG